MAKLNKNLLAFDNLDTETKEYIKTAINIFMLIKDENIIKKIKEVKTIEEKVLSKYDKKIISLFIAGSLSGKETIEEYQDIDILHKDKLLKYIGINEEDVLHPQDMDEEKYKAIYEKEFLPHILNFINSYAYLYCFNSVNSKLIIVSLQYKHTTNSSIIDDYIKETTGKLVIIDSDKNRLFDNLKSICQSDGTIEIDEEEEEERKARARMENPFMMPRKIQMNKHQKEKDNHDRTTEKKQVDKTLINEDTWKLLDEIEKRFIGQERAARQIFLNIINNQCLNSISSITAKQRSVIFIDGASGTGKTAIISAIAKKIGIPYVKRSITSFSQTGYRGADLTDIFSALVKEADGDIEKAQNGIVILEEFDKVAKDEQTNETMREAIQKELLDIIDGGQYEIQIGDSLFGRKEVFDTSNITFIALGALTKLREKKIQEAMDNFKYTYDDARVSLVLEDGNPTGFALDFENPTEETIPYTITPEDLVGIGLQEELVNRFNTFIHTDNYSVNELKRILKESTGSPIIGLKQWIEYFKKELIIDDTAYNKIAAKAYDLKQGARGNETVVNNIRNLLLEDVIMGKDKTIHLTPELIELSEKQRISRNGRS